MDIHALKVSVGEAEANRMIAELAPKDTPVQNLRLRLSPEGVTLTGDYPTMLMKVGFEMLWQLSGQGCHLRAQLANLKVSHVPATMLRGLLFKVIKDATAQEPAIQVEDESIRVDLVQLAARKGVQLGLHLSSVHCENGALVLEAGTPLV